MTYVFRIKMSFLDCLCYFLTTLYFVNGTIGYYAFISLFRLQLDCWWWSFTTGSPRITLNSKTLFLNAPLKKWPAYGGKAENIHQWARQSGNDIFSLRLTHYFFECRLVGFFRSPLSSCERIQMLTRLYHPHLTIHHTNVNVTAGKFC